MLLLFCHITEPRLKPPRRSTLPPPTDESVEIGTVGNPGGERRVHRVRVSVSGGGEDVATNGYGPRECGASRLRPGGARFFCRSIAYRLAVVLVVRWGGDCADAEHREPQLKCYR